MARTNKTIKDAKKSFEKKLIRNLTEANFYHNHMVQLIIKLNKDITEYEKNLEFAETTIAHQDQQMYSLEDVIADQESRLEDIQVENTRLANQNSYMQGRLEYYYELEEEEAYEYQIEATGSLHVPDGPDFD